MTILSEEGWGSRGVCGSASPSRPPHPPRGKKKVEGRRGEEPPRFLPRILRKGWGGAGREGADGADQWQSTGPGLGSAAGPASSRRPRGPAAPSTPPSRPGCRLLGWSRGGGGAGVPRRRILPRGWRRWGRGCEAGNGGRARTRARHERGPRVASWVKSGRATPGREPRGAGVRGQGPGAWRAELPHVNAASGRNLFVFHRASMLPY